MNKLQLLFKWPVMFGVLTIGLVSIWAYLLLGPVVTKEGGVVYYLKPGTSKQTLVAELSQLGIVTNTFAFAAYIYPQQQSSLKAGEYLFPKGATLVSIYRQVTTGKGLYFRSFAIIPGWTFTQLRRELLLTETLKHAMQGLDDKQIMAIMGNDKVAPEGEFYPETYYYTRGVADLVILKHAYDLMQSRLNQAWESRLPGLPYQDAYQALIAASLIEKEAHLNQERPIIAGVLINRLRKNMLLQIDPTVIYGMGDRYLGKIYRRDLLDDTIYNTYVHKGLPPTPIAMPSQASIDAAIHPAAHDYYYFVAKGDGSHQFSKSLPEHHRAVQSTKGQQTGYYNDSLFYSTAVKEFQHGAR